MRPGVVGLCAALSLAVVVVVAMIRDGDGVERLRIRSCRYSRLVACLDVPRLALPYRALLCSLLCPDLRCSSRLLAAHDADGTRCSGIRC